MSRRLNKSICRSQRTRAVRAGFLLRIPTDEGVEAREQDNREGASGGAHSSARTGLQDPQERVGIGHFRSASGCEQLGGSAFSSV